MNRGISPVLLSLSSLLTLWFGGCRPAGAAPAVGRPAEGAVLAPGEMDPVARGALTAEVNRRRRAVPASFRAVAEVRAQIGNLDARKRGRYAVIGPVLKGMGSDALWPMLEQLALDGGDRVGVPDSAWLAWRVGLIEAVGSLRDPRSGPVLRAVLDRAGTGGARGLSEDEFQVARAAAEALGSLGDDASAARLGELANRPGPARRAVLAGMGTCRRLVCTQVLAAALDGKLDAALAEEVVQSLGATGNAWAWKTPAVSEAAGKGEQTAVRAAAAEALIGAFIAYGADAGVRQAASNALMVVDFSGTPALVARARGAAAPRDAAALDDLAARFARNPTR